MIICVQAQIGCACLPAQSLLCCAGANNGITKNFETVREVLKDFVPVRDADKAPVVKVCSLLRVLALVMHMP